MIDYEALVRFANYFVMHRNHLPFIIVTNVSSYTIYISILSIINMPRKQAEPNIILII